MPVPAPERMVKLPAGVAQPASLNQLKVAGTEPIVTTVLLATVVLLPLPSRT